MFIFEDNNKKILEMLIEDCLTQLNEDNDTVAVELNKDKVTVYKVPDSMEQAFINLYEKNIVSNGWELVGMYYTHVIEYMPLKDIVYTIAFNYYDDIDIRILNNDGISYEDIVEDLSEDIKHCDLEDILFGEKIENELRFEGGER